MNWLETYVLFGMPLMFLVAGGIVYFVTMPRSKDRLHPGE